MELNHYVIHQLDKEANGLTRTILSESLPDIDVNAQGLIAALSERYRNRETYGRFTNRDATNMHTFPTHFANYTASEDHKANFLTFTTNAMQLLHNTIQGKPAAIGGYVVFADYSTVHGKYTSIFLVRDASGFLFSRSDGDNKFLVLPQSHVELEKLAMACKINKGKFNTEDGNYLSFIRTNRQGVSDYFIDWIGAVELRMNSEYTNNLCDIVKRIEQLPIIDGVQLDRNEFQKRVYNLCIASPTGKVNLERLGEALYGEENKDIFINYALENDIQINTEFTATKSNLKKLYRLDITADNISLKFDYNALNTIVKVKGNKVVITSQNLVNKINEANAD